VSAEADARPPAERGWWLRVPLVLQSPSAVFAALRDDRDDAAAARAEPILALTWLAGIGGVLASNVAGEILDDFDVDGILVAVWAFVGGGFYGLAGYLVLGALVHWGARLAGGQGSYRRARHVLAYAAVPLAVSLLVWPVRLAAHGSDVFRTGGQDTGAANRVFEGLELGFVLWAVALLVVGIRTVHGWTWTRALAAAALPALVPALALARAHGLF